MAESLPLQTRALGNTEALATRKSGEPDNRTEGAWRDLKEGLSRAWGDAGEALERVVRDLATKVPE